MPADTLRPHWEHGLWSGLAFQISECRISDDPEQCVTHCHRMRTIGSPFTQVSVHARYKEMLYLPSTRPTGHHCGFIVIPVHI